MTKKVNMISSAGTTIAILVFNLCFMLPKEVGADSKVAAIEGMSYNVDSSLTDNLKSLTGKKVYVTLDSGKTLSGLVKNVGNHLVHLEKLDGKEYFDALIRIENISAMDAQFRDYQR
jgi:small nuclear ribonucleoprotein (snRNP)-like protein